MNQRILLLAALSLATSACVSTGNGGSSLLAPKTTGSLTLAGPTFGEIVLAPTRCASGEHLVFLGADFSSPDSKIVSRLAIDPITGPAVRVFDQESQFAKALILRREDCATFRFSLARTGWQLNDIYALAVDLELDCKLQSGDSVKGELRATGCS